MRGVSLCGLAHEKDAMRRLARQARQAVWRERSRVEDRRLRAEQRRGVLGPAHLRWRENSAIDNRKRWSGYDWSGRGEEWNVSPEWKRALIDDVLVRWIPVRAVVLEVGPGAGRWSEFLAERASRLVLVDVSERPLKLCRERFNEDARIQYILSSGSDLPGVEGGSIDARGRSMFSFTSRRATRRPTSRRSPVCSRPVAQRLCTTPAGATVASCHPAKVGAHRCRAAYSRCWWPSAG